MYNLLKNYFKALNIMVDNEGVTIQYLDVYDDMCGDYVEFIAHDTFTFKELLSLYSRNDMIGFIIK